MSAHSSCTSRLLQTNDSPTEVEVIIVQKEAEILETQIRDLQIRLRGCHAVLSPLRRVPAELLALIIAFASPDSSGFYTDKRQLLDLCLVCKLWHQAAVNTRYLWGRLDFIVFRDSSPNWKVLDTWVRRANQASRSLRISQGRDCRHLVQLTVQCVMRSRSLTRFLVEGPPIHSLVLEVADSDCFENLVGSMQSWHFNSKTQPDPNYMAWNSLAHLELRFIENHPGSWQAAPSLSQSFFTLLPTSLVSLNVRIPDEACVERMESDSWETDPPWTSLHIPPSALQNLTSLSIACDWNGPYLLVALQHCATLQILFVDFRNAYTSWIDNMNTPGYELARRLWETGIALPKLHTLNVIGMRRSSVEQYLPFLTLPALVILRIGLSPRRYVDDTDPNYNRLEEAGFAISSVIRTLCNRCPKMNEALQSLAVETPQGDRIEAIAAQQLMHITSNLSSLKHLSLDHFSFELQPFIDAYPWTYFSTLEHLELQNLPGDFHLASLLECLEGRRRIGELDNLSRVSVSYAKHGHTAATDRWRMTMVGYLRNLGVDVQGEVEVENRALYFSPTAGRWA